MKRICRIEISVYPDSKPYLYVFRWQYPEVYIGKTPLRCARFLQMSMEVARRYQQSAYPKSATPVSPE